jgi:alginate O-acetyltransferase complex protein AlgI
VSAPRLYLNLWVCFLASGLWHGAAWTFVFWGAYHGLFLTLDRLFLKRLLLRLPRAVGVGFTFVAVTIGWVLFRAPDARGALGYLAAMIDPLAQSQRVVLVTPDLYGVMAVGLGICFLPGLRGVERLHVRLRATAQWTTISMGSAACLLLLSIAKATTVAFHPFLYFRF